MDGTCSLYLILEVLLVWRMYFSGQSNILLGRYLFCVIYLFVNGVLIM
jgi:hypothetical protein